MAASFFILIRIIIMDDIGMLQKNLQFEDHQAYSVSIIALQNTLFARWFHCTFTLSLLVTVLLLLLPLPVSCWY
jgi:hypothetical protein